MSDKWTPSLSFLIALVFHAGLILVASHQYLTSPASAHPTRYNQAARRLATVKGRPVRFIYVKDMVPSKKPPMDPTRMSDLNRRGSSPNLKKGTSPDPTSFGNSPLRQRGGPGGGALNRPSIPPAQPSLPPSPGRPAIAGQRGSQREAHRPGPGDRALSQGKHRLSRNTESPKASTGEGFKLRRSNQSVSPKGGGAAGAKAGVEESAGRRESAPLPAKPPSSGLGTQLQQMMIGSIQGGYRNPNASRLNTGEVSFDTAAWDLGPYARKVQERVQSNWHVPEAQRALRQRGWVAIRFNILKNGTVADLRLLRRSGIPSYDQSALDALRSSNPLPPLPPEVTLPKLGGVFRFFYNMSDENG